MFLAGELRHYGICTWKKQPVRTHTYGVRRLFGSRSEKVTPSVKIYVDIINLVGGRVEHYNELTHMCDAFFLALSVATR